MKFVILISLLLFLFSDLSFVACCYDEEREALLSFQSHLTDPTNRLSSWHGRNCCAWHGITCSESLHVIAIDLQNHDRDADHTIVNMNSEVVSPSNSISTALHGTISSSLFTLTRLTHLDLSFNNFMHSKIPTGFANLTRLTYLNLSNANFSGSITTQFSNLTLLRQLDISCSYIVVDYSSISIQLSSSVQMGSGGSYSYINRGNLSLSSLYFLERLPNLRQLILSGVDLSMATISTQWASPLSALSNLRILYLSNCRSSGILPVKQLLNLTSLSELAMDFNSLSSSIPYELQNLTSLLVLDLTKSDLQGPIPYLPQLEELYVDNNYDMSIDLHSTFGAPWPLLYSLDVSSTRVSGSLPTSFANITSLRYFLARNCSLQGQIPASIMNLSRLEILALDFNNLTGQLAPSVSNLKSLRFLSMMKNSLEGTIRSTICNTSSLWYLSLAKNFLRGDLPSCISQFPSLEYLVFRGNKMNGTVSSFTSSFKHSSPTMISLGDSGLTVKVDQNPLPPNFQPQILDLSSCHLGGSIPGFLSTLTQLTTLMLASNNLTGTIPPWLFNLRNLCYLDLSFNNLQGVLPRHIKLNANFLPTTLNLANNRLHGPIPSLLENVEVMDFSGNNFTGSIPLQLGVENIKYLNLSGNKLHGEIPSSFCPSANGLMFLDLANNGMKGTVRTSLGNCTSLIVLKLGWSNLSGELPNGLEGATNLSYLDLGHNHFSGPFPGFIQKLKSLKVLGLGYNNFQGRIPHFIGDLQELHIIVLRSNSFNGSIPPGITKIDKLQFVDLSSNMLSGHIPENLKGLKMMRTRPKDGNLLGYVISAMYAGVELDMVNKGFWQQYQVVRTYQSGIDLSCNSFTGNIPSEIGLLEGLYMLNLSHNYLYGEIPKTIGNMSGLESVDLSFNNLSGEIPPQITLLDSLSTFNFSHNNLSGKIPTGHHFDTLSIDGSAYVGNEFLYGGALRDSCSGNSSYLSSDSVEVDDAWQDKMFYAVVIIGYGVGFWGLFGTLYLIKGSWRKSYWRAIDLIAFIIQCVRKQD